MALLTIEKAAKLVGKSRKTLYNDIHKGKLSITQTETGTKQTKQVDTSELIRVYGEIGVKGNSKVNAEITQSETPIYTHDLVTKNAFLEAEIKALREKLTDKDQLIASKDQNLEDMRNTVRLLEHKANKKPWWKW